MCIEAIFFGCDTLLMSVGRPGAHFQGVILQRCRGVSVESSNDDERKNNEKSEPSTLDVRHLMHLRIHIYTSTVA
jgi:hypothetical protein